MEWGEEWTDLNLNLESEAGAVIVWIAPAVDFEQCGEATRNHSASFLLKHLWPL